MIDRYYDTVDRLEQRLGDQEAVIRELHEETEQFQTELAEMKEWRALGLVFIRWRLTALRGVFLPQKSLSQHRQTGHRQLLTKASSIHRNKRLP